MTTTTTADANLYGGLESNPALNLAAIEYGGGWVRFTDPGTHAFIVGFNIPDNSKKNCWIGRARKALNSLGYDAVMTLGMGGYPVFLIG